MSEPRYATPTPAAWESASGCLDCGVIVFDQAAHTRFHSILSGHAWSLAVLKTAHIAGHVHDKYEVVTKIDSKKFDSWSGDALAEVAAGHGIELPT